jgi:hypothetical protein
MLKNLIGSTVVDIAECRSKKYGSGQCFSFSNGSKIYPVDENSMGIWANPIMGGSGKIPREAKSQKIISVNDLLARKDLLGAKLVFVTEDIDDTILTFLMKNGNYVEFEANSFPVTSPPTLETKETKGTRENCDFINTKLASTKCPSLDVEKMYEFDSKYMQQFMGHFLRNQSLTCFGGHIFIDINHNPNVKRNMRGEIATIKFANIPATYWKKRLDENKPFYINIGIFFPQSNDPPHANTLLIHPDDLTIELFEPHGQDAEWTDAIILMLRTFFRDFTYQSLGKVGSAEEFKTVTNRPFLNYSVFQTGTLPPSPPLSSSSYSSCPSSSSSTFSSRGKGGEAPPMASNNI